MSEREELADTIRSAGFATPDGIADAILASDWLAARDARIREEALVEVAVAISRGADRSAVWTGPAIEAGVRQAALLEAARIARAVIDTPAQTSGEGGGVGE